MKRKLETIDGTIEYFVLGNKNSSMTYFINAGKHGNEPEGVVLVKEYILPYLKENNYFGKQFVVFPNLNPLQIKGCMEAIEQNYSFEYCRQQFRYNKQGVNLNGDYPTANLTVDEPAPLQAKQTKLILALQEVYGFKLMLDFHSNGSSHLNIYKYDEEVGRCLAHNMALKSPAIARDYVHYKNKGMVLSGTSGTYFGKERGIPILTIELGVRKMASKSSAISFAQHCESLWNMHKEALEYLFREVMPNENDADYQDYVDMLDGLDDEISDGCGYNGVSAS